jgi:membrane dipeptidase
MIVDVHSDLVRELVLHEDRVNPFAEHWLPALRAGGVKVQVCAINTSAKTDADHVALAQAQLDALHRAVDANPGAAILVRTREDLETALRDDRLGIVLGMEGAEALGGDPAAVDVLWDRGVRVFGPSWFGANPFADGNGARRPGRGLTGAGRDVVRSIAERGGVIDLAHASDRTFDDVLAAVERNCLIVSHTGCRALFDDHRNVTDGQLRAIAERDGVVGVFAISLFLDPRRPTLERFVDHLDHVAEVAGPRHAGVTGDFLRRLISIGAFTLPGFIELPEGVPFDAGYDELNDPLHYPRLREALAARGYEGPVLDGVLGENFLRVLRRTLPCEASASAT